MSANPVDLERELLNISLSLYDNDLIPRNIIKFFMKTLIKFNNSFQEFTLQRMNESFKHHLGPKSYQIMKNIFNEYNEIIKKFDSEYKRFEIYKNQQLIFLPIEYPLEKYERKTSSAQYIPMKWTLKLFLEIPGTFQVLYDYVSSLKEEKEIISNFIHAKQWEENLKRFPNVIIIPIFFYHDEFKAGSALGSHCGKNSIESVYIIIPCFPPEITSQLRNILVQNLFFSKDKKKCGNRKVFRKVIAEFNDLQKKD